MAAVTTAAPDVRLRMRDIRKRFGATVALDGVDLQVRRGEVHALVGENGAGKSTLVRVLAGAERADSGAMDLDGEPFAPADPLDARRRGVAMIHQELSLAGHLTVEQNICLGMEPAVAGIVKRAEAGRRARAALEMLGHGDIPLHAAVHALGLAERQIVEIARAVSTGCRVLVMDEPTSSLGRADVDRLFRLVQRLRTQGHAVVYISHFLEEVRRISDRFTVLRDGRVAGTGDTASATVPDLVNLMVGRQVGPLYPRSPRTPGEELLAVEAAAGSARPARASLQLRRGEVLGIAGLVGSGRTELLRMLFGLDPIRSGRVRLAAWDGPATPRQRLRQGMGLLSEDRQGEGLALSLSLADNLTLSCPRGLGRGGWIVPSRQRQAALRWIEHLNIRCRTPFQPARSLSGGNQQKLALARLLHHDVDVLLLDEPTRGIDVASKAQIYERIDALARGGDGARPKAIMVVSSYLPELLGVCDRIAVMSRGVLGEPRPAEAWTEEELMAEAAGRAAA